MTLNSNRPDGISYVAATLPFEGRRSQVRSNKRTSTVRRLNTPINRHPIDECAKLITAVAAVLARYEGCEGVTMGVSKAGQAKSTSLSIRYEGTLDALLSQATKKLSELSWDAEDSSPSPSSFAVVVQIDDTDPPSSSFDVALWMEEGVRLVAAYDARLFRADTVDKFLGHLDQVLATLQSFPSQTIEGVSIVSEAEKSELLSFASSAAPAFAGTLQELIATALENEPANPAVEFEGRALRLSELVSRADEIGLAVGKYVQAKSARVGIALRPSFDQIAALLATIRLGCVIVPLDTTLPANRQEEIRTDAGLAAIITEAALAGHFQAENVVILERLVTKGTVAPRRVEATSPDEPLYLMFTSGSTGRPKGVLVPHRTLANLLACEDRRKHAAGRRTLGRTSIAFDVGLQEIFATILFGGTLVIATDEERANIGALATLLSDRRISRVYLPPVALHQMVESTGQSPAEIGTLEEVIVAGEQLAISPAIRRFFRTTRAQLINQYGPTETHVATEEILESAPLRWPDHPSIGRPIVGARVYIADRYGELSPTLVPGEIVIGGIVPAIGYVGTNNRPNSFISDRHASNTMAVAYRTGDRARWLPDGRLEFLGRSDDQIKIRGYRVELGDLEANTLRLPGVRQAAAKYWQTKEWTGIALYIVPANNEATSIRHYRDALRTRVPEYMIPPLSAITLLDQLPLSRSGKTDRSALPHPGTPEQSEAENTTTLDRVAAIWRRRIGIGAIGPDDNFLDLGGHSLLAIQIVSEVNDMFEIRVPLSTLLRGSTLKQFSNAVEDLLSRQRGGPDASPSTSPNDHAEELSLRYVDLPVGRFATLSAAEAQHLWKEIWGQQAYRHRSFRYRPGSTVIDIGANIGLFSRYALETTGGCRLIAIEPSPELFDCLERNLASFRRQVELLQLGCGAEDDEHSAFWFFPHVPSMSSFAPRSERDSALLGGLLSNNPNSSFVQILKGPNYLAAAFEGRKQTVKRRRITTVMKELGIDAVDLLKIDVQRGEQEVLQGIDEEAWTKISQIVVELQDHSGSIESTLLTLKYAGFATDVGSIELHRGTDVKFVYGWRDDTR